ncbi:MAG TPA: hypothetical protein O0X41_03640, partial [Methanocorpusculum sp.]|nr:hypothetical protein [Methanocorpusculum sp.]
NKVPADVLRAQIMRDGEIADLVMELNSTEPQAESQTIPVVPAPVPFEEPAAAPAEPPKEPSQITAPEPVHIQSPEEVPHPKMHAEVPEIRPEPVYEPEPHIFEIPETEVPLETVATITGLVERTEAEAPPAAAPETVQQPVLVAEPRTVAEHADWMRQTGRARVLTGEGAIYGDYSIAEMLDMLPKLKGDFAGIIIDEPVNQKFVDIAAEKGMKFIVAKNFEGIVRRPVSLRMIPL